MHIMPLFISNWEAVHTDIMRFGFIGVTEGQFTVMFILAFTGLYGSKYWHREFLGFELRVIMAALALMLAIWQSIIGIHLVNQSLTLRGKDHGPAWNQLLQFMGLLLFPLFVLLVPGTQFWATQDNFRLLLLTTGLVFSYLVTRLIVCHVTDMPFAKFHMILLPLPLLLLNSLARVFIGGRIFCEVRLMKAYLAVVVAIYGFYVHGVISEITEYLGIQCFHIKPKSAATDSTDGNAKTN